MEKYPNLLILRYKEKVNQKNEKEHGKTMHALDHDNDDKLCIYRCAEMQYHDFNSSVVIRHEGGAVMTSCNTPLANIQIHRAKNCIEVFLRSTQNGGT